MQTPPVPSLLVLALEQLPDAVMLCRPLPGPADRLPDLEVVWANASAVALHPGSGEGPVGHLWSALYAPQVHERLLDVARQVLDGDGPAEGDLELHGTGGNRSRHYHAHAELLPDRTLLWVLRDVSDRHQATSDLADRERRLRRALVKLQGLQDITAALAGAMTVTDVARVVTDITFDVLGVAAGGLALIDARRDELVFRRLTGVGEEFRERFSAMPVDGDNPLAHAVREQRPVYLRDRAELLARWPDLAATMGGQGRALLPLTADRTLGGMALVWDQAKEFSDSEQLFLSTMAAQCALALARVQLFEAQATAAHNLQHALLPSRLPDLPGVQGSARYFTADGDAVGGDWYDMFVLPSGAIGLVIGDVEGHSSAAAAIMGQARNVIRAYSAQTCTPAEVLTRANQFLAVHTDVLVTCCYLELRPKDRTVTVATAGHPCPVVAEPGRPARELEVAPGPPLGVLPDAEYDERTVLLHPGSTLTLFTDGLVEEHPGRPHSGLPELLATASRLAGRHPDEVADALADLVGQDAAADDTAVLVVRLTEEGRSDAVPTTATRVFGPSRAATPAARRYVRDVLEAWGLPGAADAAELLVSELVTNAVVHTAGTVSLSVRRTGADRVWIGVRDDSERLPRRQSAAGDDVAGRGLAIVAQLADRWGVEPCPTGSGKVVWLELHDGRAGTAA